jgi:TPR repeat protein
LGCQINVGIFYADGIGVKRNRERALYWHRLAYRRGSGAAAANVGVLFRDEGKIPQALAWFKRAVKLQNADANLQIAKIYLQKADESKAVIYLRRTSNAMPNHVTEASREEAQDILRRLLK